MENWQSNLIVYGTHLLASQLGKEWPLLDSQTVPGSLAEDILQRAGSYNQDQRLQLARKIVYDTSLESGLKPLSPVQPVTSVFHLLSYPPGVIPRDRDSPCLAALNIPSPTGDDMQSNRELFISPSDLWREFWEALNRIPILSEFDTFFYLLARYGWNVPGTIADPLSPGLEHGLSVFEQFKAIVALGYCLDPALDEGQPIGLVAGDLPGIQRMLYTITAKGAAKTLRGHSAYLQLLSDALVRLFLRHLELSWANVVFSAGGNFLIVTPEYDEAQLNAWQDAINAKLLTLHRGELYLALASVAIPARLYADASPATKSGSLAQKRTDLQRRLEAAKRAAFAKLAPAHYADLFGPIGDGGGAIAGESGTLCEVCHVEIDEPTRVTKPEEDGEEALLLCEQCHSFAYQADPDETEFEYDSLAWRVANADRLFISDTTQPPSLDKYQNGKGNPPWNVALEAMGLMYQLLKLEDKLPTEPGTLLAFNPKRFLPEELEPLYSYGFRFLSQSTPRQDSYGKEIRDFHSIAREDTVGIHRYGVLRMDVDSLGQTMSGKNLTYPDLLHLSALSNALAYFFGGMLDQIGRDCVEAWQKQTANWNGKTTQSIHKWPYVIYAGGDDLFIVAAWDLLPPLAQAIRRRFDEFCLGRLTMSGGIAIAREKYPLYRAAEQAGLALEQSKDRIVEDERTMLITARKDALTFLGVTLAWEEVAQARKLTEKLASMLKNPQGEEAPRALLQLLYYVAQLYQREADSGEAGAVKLGQWLPALHYGLRRMQRRMPDSLKGELAEIPNQVLNLDAVLAAGERLQGIDQKVREVNKRQEEIDVELKKGQREAETELRRTIQTQLDQTCRDWPLIRYLGLPVRWAEFLTRKEERFDGTETH
jgi:CRISPR-associated protein Csm1